MTTEQSSTASRWWTEKTQLLNGARCPAVDVYLRSLAPPVGVREQQEAILTELRTLQREGRIEGVNEVVWGKAVSPDGQCQHSPAGREMLDRIETFRTWAATEEPTVNIPFEESYADSEITGERFRKIVLPSRCVSISVEETIELVAPCRVEDEEIRIQDLLEAFDVQQAQSGNAVHSE